MIKAEIVADSLDPRGHRLTSFLVTFPRIILAEFNTHRMFSRNSSSSRAIPFKTMVRTIEENPFVPIAWQHDHKGMQGNTYLEGEYLERAKESWLSFRDEAVARATHLNSGCSVTKQLANRCLETFMWQTVLITSGEEGLRNFFDLRCPQYELEIDGAKTFFRSRKEFKNCWNAKKPDNVLEQLTDLDWLKLNKGQAEIHIMQLAELMYDAYNESTPESLNEGEWHIPFKSKIEYYAELVFNNLNPIQPASINWYQENFNFFLVKVATAMAARTSYTTVGDEKELNYSKMIELHDRLINQDPLHASPMEHCAKVMTQEEYERFVKGEYWIETSNMYPAPNWTDDTLGWCRNFRGFIQYRHILETKS